MTIAFFISEMNGNNATCDQREELEICCYYKVLALLLKLYFKATTKKNEIKISIVDTLRREKTESYKMLNRTYKKQKKRRQNRKKEQGH